METKDAVTFADGKVALHHDMKWDYFSAYIKLFKKDWAAYNTNKIAD
jgi:hypothetical protein